MQDNSSEILEEKLILNLVEGILILPNTASKIYPSCHETRKACGFILILFLRDFINHRNDKYSKYIPLGFQCE